ncbi:hypothetical protein GGI07_003806 [Coemansia sp. Benny D115]|nr:hypothetical protein GGI07_003806 [Coemansia sp. Benny D115]
MLPIFKSLGGRATCLRCVHTSRAVPVEMKRQPLPTTTSIVYTIPKDPYQLAGKFRDLLRQGKMDDAVAVVMQAKKSSQSAVVWNLVIDAYARDGRLSRALRGFTEMRRRGFQPTPSTYTCLFKACALSQASKSVEVADELYESMGRYGVEPTAVCTNALLSVYQRKHMVAKTLQRFNAMRMDGPEAPTLATYTTVVSVLRRELQERLKQLDGVTRDSRIGQVAMAKERVHEMFSMLMQTWNTYLDDASRRMTERDQNRRWSAEGETPLLHFDARIVNLVLKACHIVYRENRALGRQGLKAAEAVYGLDRKIVGPLGQSGAAEADSLAPLAVRMRRMAPGGDGSKDAPAIDSTTIDLVLELCRRDGELTKAVRFWRSVERHFVTTTPSTNNYAMYLDTLLQRIQQSQ